MSREDVIAAMADTALDSEGVEYTREHHPYGYQWADERARQWWIRHHERALKRAEALGWHLAPK